MANYILEGVYFYSGFMFFYNLARMGKMPGSAQEIRYINRDENTHLWLFRSIILELQKEEPQLFSNENTTMLREMLEEGVRQEIAWGRYVLGDAIPGLTGRHGRRLYQVPGQSSLELVGIRPTLRGVSH